MTNGEWLLKNQVLHRSMYNTIQKRYQQLKKNVPSIDETIEGMALQGLAWDSIGARSGSNSHGSRTEQIALSHDKARERQQREVSEEIEALRQKLTLLNNYLEIFDCIVAGLNEMENWIVTVHHLHGKSLRSLCNSQAPDGDIYSVTTLRRRKEEMIVKVDLLISQTNAHFERHEL